MMEDVGKRLLVGVIEGKREEFSDFRRLSFSLLAGKGNWNWKKEEVAWDMQEQEYKVNYPTYNEIRLYHAYSRQDIDDITSDAMESILSLGKERIINTCREKGIPIIAYLVGIIKTSAKRYMASNAAWNGKFLEYTRSGNLRESVEDMALLDMEFWHLLEETTIDHPELFTLASLIVEGYTQQEIADTLGIHRKTVRRWLDRLGSLPQAWEQNLIRIS